MEFEFPPSKHDSNLEGEAAGRGNFRTRVMVSPCEWSGLRARTTAVRAYCVGGKKTKKTMDAVHSAGRRNSRSARVTCYAWLYQLLRVFNAVTENDSNTPRSENIWGERSHSLFQVATTIPA